MSPVGPWGALDLYLGQGFKANGKVPSISLPFKDAQGFLSLVILSSEGKVRLLGYGCLESWAWQGHRPSTQGT